MPGGLLLLATALVTATPAPAEVLTLELRVFNGGEDVTSQTRVSVYRTGDRTSPVFRMTAGRPRLEIDVPPGIYDVQAIRERDERVVTIRWAERLVVMPYPDENGHHLEVINFQAGYGAVQVRRSDAAGPDAAVYRVGDRAKAAAQPVRGQDYALFVLRAGSYDIQTVGPGGPVWHLGFEVPLDRTRLLIAR